MRAAPPCALLLATAVALALGVAPRARADVSPVVRVDYAAPTACPAERGFVDQLVARAPRARIAGAAEPARTLVVRIAAVGGRFGGHLMLRELDGRETERDLSADACAELVSSLALVAAVAVDPAVAPPAVTATATPTASQAASASATSSAPPNPSAPTATAPALPDDPALGRPWRVRLGLGLEALDGPEPDVVVGVPAVSLDVTRSTHGLVRPSFRARFTSAAHDTANARFAWHAGSLEGCPIASELGPLDLTACARAEAGTLYARGLTFAPGRERTRPWVSLGPVGRARVQLIGNLGLEAEASLIFPVIRDRFYADPTGETLFRPRAVGWAAGGGASLLIW